MSRPQLVFLVVLNLLVAAGLAVVVCAASADGLDAEVTSRCEGDCGEGSGCPFCDGPCGPAVDPAEDGW